MYYTTVLEGFTGEARKRYSPEIWSGEQVIFS